MKMITLHPLVIVGSAVIKAIQKMESADEDS